MFSQSDNEDQLSYGPSCLPRPTMLPLETFCGTCASTQPEPYGVIFPPAWCPGRWRPGRWHQGRIRTLPTTQR